MLGFFLFIQVILIWSLVNSSLGKIPMYPANYGQLGHSRCLLGAHQNRNLRFVTLAVNSTMEKCLVHRITVQRGISPHRSPAVCTDFLRARSSS